TSARRGLTSTSTIGGRSATRAGTVWGRVTSAWRSHARMVDVGFNPRTGHRSLPNSERQAGERQRVLGPQQQAVDLQELVVAVHAGVHGVRVRMVRVEAVDLCAARPDE